ncbi:MAG TPA: FAD-binding oxidoreductase [Nocardioides sp.]|uniref:FAD-binding oxidoreductase n=1 Tax=Nocardioides sp. TaxID=35761 RepID=UPI002C8B6FAC|nr:FAD-binding oxidoreductase [Nocardioides sp.]HQR27793.1 FAD-binding oxidoreductase [Nocardioides sp.]
MSDRELLTGWGCTAATAARVVRATPDRVAEELRTAGSRGVIARGLGRSYGDVAQNAGGVVLLPAPGSVRIDHETQQVTVGAGTSLHDLMRVLLPEGYFVPVTPGTRFVTLGGAIACDVHGKNHHRAGSLGDHVVSLDLVLPDGSAVTVGPQQDPDLYWATVGGLGLTGIVTSVVLSLLRVESGWMRVDTDRLPDLDAVMDAITASDRDTTYSVAWIDTLARGRALGRSVLTRGEHARWEELTGRAVREPVPLPGDPRLGAPGLVPPHLVSRPTVRAFNELWFRKAPRQRKDELQTIASFFHPLDGVAHWNRLYGRQGFLQYQCVLPDPEGGRLARILERISAAGHASFLAVLKRFGPGNPGPLSFPTVGWTLALDLPVGAGLVPLLAELDREVVGAGGRIYLAKDSRLPGALLEQMYPRLDEFRAVRARVDPTGVLRSDLSRRLDL